MSAANNSSQGPGGAARVEDTVKDFWATRPRRPRRGRKLAGVAAGIANRYRIDPVLVRVGFVVAAIYGGAGVLVYLLGWLFLPEQDDEVSPIESLLGKGRSSTSSGFTVLLGILMVPVLGWFFGGAFTGEFSSWMGLFVLGALLFLLQQTRGHVAPVTPEGAAPPPPPPAPTPPPMPFMPTMPMPTAAPSVTQPVTQPAQPVGQPVDMPPPAGAGAQTTPPAWDPLGAAPFAWDLPEPSTPEPEEPEPPVKRRKPKVGTATLGLALVATAALAIVGNETTAGSWLTPHHIVGVVLAIVGLGMVFGAFLRAGRGLIALAVPLSVAGMAMTAVSPGGYHGIGDLTVQPTTIASVRPSYERSVGSVEVDLTNLPDVGRVRTSAHTGVGNVEVIVPANADVVVSCSNGAGYLQCLDAVGADGVNQSVNRYSDDGADGPGGLRIILEASADTGNVEVRRG